jgi:ABC-type multidrug transport system permease subunit
MRFDFRPRHIVAIMRRDLLQIRSYAYALSFDIAFGTVELFIYFFVSRTFADVPSESLSGAPSYFAFVAVGIVLTGMIGAASGEIVSRIRTEQLVGTLETLIAQPIRPAELCLGISGYPFVFALVRAIVYFSVAVAVLGLRLPDASWLGFLIVFAATGAALLGIGIALAAFAVVYKRGANLGWVVALALGLTGGAYFPISVLPEWLETASEALPTRHIFDGARLALFEGSGWGSEALALFAFSAVCLPASLWVFAGAIEVARRRGSLAEY